MASQARRQKRFEERQSKKLFQKISQQTLNKINQQSPEEREKLLLLYKNMLEQKQKDKENGM
jgi:hypothetical protein